VVIELIGRLRKGNEKFMPHLLGHEGCGIVEEIGPGVTKVGLGDKVVMHWRKGSGIESRFFPIYSLRGLPLSGGKVTTLSEYSVVSENRITKVPTKTSNDFVALLGCGLSTGFSVVNKDANVKFGESVLVLGCGGVGLNCILAAKAHRVSCIARDAGSSTS
jgi:Zn-dependent alcohol dehydrogenase